MKVLVFAVSLFLSVVVLGADNFGIVGITKPKPTIIEDKIKEPVSNGLPKFDIDAYYLDKNKYLNEYLSDRVPDGKVFKVHRSIEFGGDISLAPTGQEPEWTVLSIQFYQLDNDVRFLPGNKIEIDIKTSTVTKLNLQVLPSVFEKFGKRPLISADRAYELAYHVLATQIPHLSKHALSEGETFINAYSEPYIQYSVSDYVISVNLVTGDTKFWSMALSVEYPTDSALNGHADVKNNVCKTIEAFPNATACKKVHSETTEEIGFPAIVEYIEADKSYMHCLDTNGPAPGGYGPICQDMSDSDKAMIDAWVYLNEWEKDTDRYSTSTDNANFPEIDIVAYSSAKDDKGVPRADYRAPHKGIPNGNIVLPKKGVHPGFKSDVDPLKNRELIIHEAAHSETVYLNSDFALPDRHMLRAIGEAISDVKALRTPGPHEMPIDTWVFGKTIFKDGYERDMRVNRTFSEFDPAKSPHSNSTIFSHYFFLLAHKEKMTNDKLLQLVTILPAYIDKSTDITVEEFITAVKKVLVQIKLEELQQEADKILSQMNDPSGEYPETPTPVIGIFGDFTGCNGSNSLATVKWINSENADSFKVYGRLPNGPWTYEGTTNNTYQNVFVIGADYAEWRADACLGEYCAVSGATWRQINKCDG